MRQRTIFERTMEDLRTEIAALRSQHEHLTAGKAYRVAEVAQLLQLSESTIKRAGWAGFLLITRGRVLGEDALQWFRDGAKTGRDNNDVNIGGRRTT